MTQNVREMLEAKAFELLKKVQENQELLRKVLNDTRATLAEIDSIQKAVASLYHEEAETRANPSDSVSRMVNRFQILESKTPEARVDSAITMVNGLTKREVARRKVRPGTIKAAVLAILEAYPSGLIAIDILRLLNEARAVPLERTSLSPQLSRLAQDGLILRRGSLWFLPKEDVRATREPGQS